MSKYLYINPVSGGCVMMCFPFYTCLLANRMSECACVPYTIPGGFTAMRVKLRTMGGIKVCQISMRFFIVT